VAEPTTPIIATASRLPSSLVVATTSVVVIVVDVFVQPLPRQRAEHDLLRRRDDEAPLDAIPENATTRPDETDAHDALPVRDTEGAVILPSGPVAP
jgi:hypothetical protein